MFEPRDCPRLPEVWGLRDGDLDTPAAESAWPRLTTIHQPTADMAEAAVEMLIESFGDERFRGKARARQLEYRLVTRDSAAPPAN